MKSNSLEDVQTLVDELLEDFEKHIGFTYNYDPIPITDEELIPFGKNNTSRVSIIHSKLKEKDPKVLELRSVETPPARATFP